MENSNGALVLTPNEVRKLLKCSRGTIYEEIRKGTIPSIRLGRKILIPRHALMKWLEQEGGNTLHPQE